MTKTQLEELYKVSCAGKGFKPTDGQFKVWTLTLLHLEHADLSQALVWYFSENTNFPMPAELKQLAEKSRRQRLAAKDNRQRVTFVCPVCRMRVVGFYAPGEDTTVTCRSSDGPWTPGKGCAKLPPCADRTQQPICGAILEIESDERAA